MMGIISNDTLYLYNKLRKVHKNSEQNID